ncbi:protein kinase [Streptomyces ziwulingensis]|uniref:protein kinase n=1 Tax=Streptomyces ziwulingensis TaxID=1045501 RepID=UPI0031E79E32
MDDYAGRVLADRYRLPLPPSDEYELTETRAFDTYSGQEVLVRQVPLPEVVEAEVLDAEGLPDGFTARDGAPRRPVQRSAQARATTRRPADPAVRRAVEAAQAAASIPDHPRLDQVFDVFAEDGSLWVVSELVPSRPLAALLAEQPLSPYRAAEIASDVLMALRVLHAHGWVHRNITARTVLVCDDGRVMLTGLAVGAAEEALCGYDPVPPPDEEDGGAAGRRSGGSGTRHAIGPGHTPGDTPDHTPGHDPGHTRGHLPEQAPGHASGPASLEKTARPGGGGTAGAGAGGGGGAGGLGGPVDPEAARRAAIQARAAGPLPVPGGERGGEPSTGAGPRAIEGGGDIRAARAGAIAAYQAGARAAARIQEAQTGRAALPGARSAADDNALPPAGGSTQPPYPGGPGAPVAPGGTPPGQIADPYGVRTTSWHTAAPRPTTGEPAGPSGGPALSPARSGPAPAGNGVPAASRWDDLVAGAPVRRGPSTALAAERARQARMAVVGPVTERWAPEQAGPVHENWQLAPPIGPATDLWALGALLFRAVQGHAPYPEESTAELVQMVCAEPPAFAEECGPLRPVVESLLRQDPIDRLDFEDLRGWLRSLVRSAPEPDAGLHVIAVPPVESGQLPVVRRRGELVRRRRGLPAHHGRHKRAKREGGSPRRLGRNLVLLILLGMAGLIAYAMFFMPKADETSGADTPDRTGAVGDASQAPPARSQDPGNSGDDPRPDGSAPEQGASPSRSAGSTEPQTTEPGAADGFTLHKDAEGFRIAVAEGWNRTALNGRGQVVYAKGDFELLVVPGRDATGDFGGDPMTYQRDKEPELQPYRDSSWATSAGLKSIEVGGRSMAEGQFTWTGDDGGELYVRNLAILLDGRYHVVQVRGPEAERDEVTRLYEQASATYRYTG